MRDKFVTQDFQLDLSRLNLRWEEKNPWFQDEFSFSFSFPFTMDLTADLKKQLGNYPSLHAVGLKKIHAGHLVWEGKISSAKMEILEVQADRIRAQICSGFDRFPGFDKKLNELNLEHRRVTDIFRHAQETVRKKYPQTNYNFPAVIYDKHDPSEAGWQDFSGFLNERPLSGFMKYTAGKGTRNIIHPMPYLLHVLKTGFSDAGYELTGHILQDKDFEQRVIYAPAAYYNTADQKEQVLTIDGADYEKKTDTRLYTSALYRKTFAIDTPGRYRLIGNILIGDKDLPLPHYYFVRIKINDYLTFWTSGRAGTKNIAVNIEVHADRSKENTLEIVMEAPVKETVLSIRLNIIAKRESETGEVIPEIINTNEVDLRQRVPDMTFGDLVTIIKNWKNYDLEIKGKQVVMNLLYPQVIHPFKDIRNFEVKAPKRIFCNKRSYRLSFPDMDKAADALDSFYIDEKGLQINGIPKEDTQEIRINGYCLPIETYRGKKGASVKKDDQNTL